MENAMPQILLAEDNAFNQKITVAMLNKLGLKADTAKDGQEAFEKASKTNYSLIFMDCEMPVMDGFTATQKIREHEQITGQRVPIVAMTGHNSSEDRAHCLNIGMDDYVAKPFKLETLRELLARWNLAQYNSLG
jgi:CheY-like chemotaxis protein